MQKNLKTRHFYLYFIIILFASILIFKDTLFFKNEILCEYNHTELLTINYKSSHNYFIPNNEHAYLEFSLPSTEISLIEIYAKPISNDLQIGVSELIHPGEVLNTINFFPLGSKYTRINIETLETPNIIFRIQGNGKNDLYIDKIAFSRKSFDPLQKSPKWIITSLFIILISFAISFLLTYLDIKKRECNSSSLRTPIVRDSNLELLRIISMLLIIAHHCVVHGGILNAEYSWQKIVAVIFLPGGKICFDAFIAISSWFLVDATYKSERFIKTWTQVFFYSVIFTIISWAYGTELTLTQFLSSFLPITGNSHGFAASYLAFYLLLPFIVKLTKDLNKKQARTLLLFLFYFQVASQIIGTINSYYQPLYSEIGLFIFCFVLSLNLKKWPIKIFENQKFNLIIVIISWLFIIQKTYSDYWSSNSKLTTFISSITRDESSLLYIIAGYALFFLFKNLRIKNKKSINYIASLTFGILLIHDHNFFRSVLWSKIIRTSEWFYSDYYIILLLITIIGIFFVCAVIEMLRQRLIEPFISSICIKKLEKKNE